MRRTALLVMALCLLWGGVVSAEEFDIAGALKLSFADLALLPSRLTLYNQHDDAATASYTCCKPWQHKEMLAAIKANEAFMENHPGSDYADDTLMHYAWVTSVRKDFKAQAEAYEALLRLYPDSHMADDAAYRLGCLFCADKDHPRAVQVLSFIINRFPTSVWADDAYMMLVREYDEMDNEAATIAALEALAYRHPDSDYCAQALNTLAQKYFSVESYDRSIGAAEELIRRYPNCDFADDAQIQIADSLRLSNQLRPAFSAYEDLLRRMPGSSLSNRAMRESNNLRDRLVKLGQAVPGEAYNTLAFDPGREAQDLWERAQHFQNYREYREAVSLYRQFLERFPGNDNFDDALFQIGESYRNMKILFEEINTAKGPDDLFRLSGRYSEATGSGSMIPAANEVQAINDASSAFAMVINRFPGSALRDDALYKIAEAYTPYEDPEKVTPDSAYVFQALLVLCPDSPNAFEALVKTVRFYANPANYEDVKKMYPEAAAALPGLFPVGLVDDKDTFLELMGLYARHTEFAWFECHFHHIPYVLTPPDLEQPAYYYQASMLMSRGNFNSAALLLQKLVQARTGDLYAPAAYLLARCYQEVGNAEAAKACLQQLATAHKESGLSDDADLLLCADAAAGDEFGKYAQQAEAALGTSVAHLDSYVGKRVVVFAPYPVAPLMRMYNMPNIWEQAASILEDWTGVPCPEKTLIYVDPTGKQCAGNPVRVSALGIKDPPDWMLGLEQLSANALKRALGNRLPDNCPALAGLCQFAAASLQYDLVTETRDAIGSAAAVKLPQEAVVQARENALKSLEKYVQSGADGNPDAVSVAGMLYALLDQTGQSQEQLINREPYRRVFAIIRGLPDDCGGLPAFGLALDRAFNGKARPTLRQWGVPIANAPYQLPTAAVGGGPVS